MAKAPFDRYTIRKESVGDSGLVNRQFGQDDLSLRFLIEHLLSPRAAAGSPAAQMRSSFFGGSFRVAAVNPAAMQVTVAPGLGFIYDLTDVPTDIGAPDYNSVDDLSPLKPLPLVAPVTFNVPAAPAGPNTRIDIIEVRTDRRQTDTTLEEVFDDATESFIPNGDTLTLSFALDGETGSVNAPADSVAGLSYKVGVAANPGVVPATSPGYTKIAEILVGSAVATITDQNIIDRRVIAAPGGVLRVAGAWRLQWNGGAPIITLRGIQAPPGVSLTLAVDAAPQKARFLIGVVGGQIASGTCVCQAFIEAGAGATEFVIVSNDTVVPVVEALPNTTIQGRFAAGNPAVNAAIGAQILLATYQAAYQTGATTNITNAKLEDLEIEFSATLAY